MGRGSQVGGAELHERTAYKRQPCVKCIQLQMTLRTRRFRRLLIWYAVNGCWVASTQMHECMVVDKGETVTSHIRKSLGEDCCQGPQ